MARYKDLFRYLKRDSEKLFAGSHHYHTSYDLSKHIVDTLPVNGKILVLYNVELVVALIEMKGVDPKQITFFTDNDNKNVLMELYGVKVTYNLSGKYDLILSNPPFNDEKVAGGQNKLYERLSKQCFSLLTDTGTISFTTPISVLKKNKRFSLLKRHGLKEVDFTVESYFKKRVCHWVVDKTYTGLVKVSNKQGTMQVSKDTAIIDTSKSTNEFAKVFYSLKAATVNPRDRMFRQNNHGPALSKTKTESHTVPLYKLDNGEIVQTYWTKRQPHAYGKRKLSIPMTKSLREEVLVVDTKDFDMGYMCIEIDNDVQLSNIKSFILSDYFLSHVRKWKQLDASGYNYAIKYLPPFDVNKKWTNDEVKKFIETC